MIPSGWMTVADAARLMKKDRSNCLKLLKREAIETALIFNDDDRAVRGQQVSIVKRGDIEGLMQKRINPQTNHRRRI